MRRKSLWIVVVVTLMLAAASAAAIASLGDGDEPNQNVSVIRTGPPGGGDCICPANWDPVVCKAADGSRHYFSNGCVAGCNGFTRCEEAHIRQP